jgi:hypothetical protein
MRLKGQRRATQAECPHAPFKLGRHISAFPNYDDVSDIWFREGRRFWNTIV